MYLNLSLNYGNFPRRGFFKKNKILFSDDLNKIVIDASIHMCSYVKNKVVGFGVGH